MIPGEALACIGIIPRNKGASHIFSLSSFIGHQLGVPYKIAGHHCGLYFWQSAEDLVVPGGGMY